MLTRILRLLLGLKQDMDPIALCQESNGTASNTMVKAIMEYDAASQQKIAHKLSA